MLPLCLPLHLLEPLDLLIDLLELLIYLGSL